MTVATERYAEMVRAYEAQQATLPRGGNRGGDRWGGGAARYREDPFREHETLNALLSFIKPIDVVLDIGGGAGRYLPIALHCREYVNVEPSPGMGTQFDAAVEEAGIKNARRLQSDCLNADLEGDVAFCANVVYYIEDIVPFIEKLQAMSRRRVMIVMHSVPPRNVGAELFRQVHGREPAPDPGYRELLPVLWDMGLLPDVHVLGPSDFIAERDRYPGRAEAIEAALPAAFEGEDLDRARRNVDAHFDEIFVMTPEGGYRRKPIGISRVLLITWPKTRDA
jgi:hypothetical protein